MKKHFSIEGILTEEPKYTGIKFVKFNGAIEVAEDKTFEGYLKLENNTTKKIVGQIINGVMTFAGINAQAEQVKFEEMAMIPTGRGTKVGISGLTGAPAIKLYELPLNPTTTSIEDQKIGSNLLLKIMDNLQLNTQTDNLGYTNNFIKLSENNIDADKYFELIKKTFDQNIKGEYHKVIAQSLESIYSNSSLSTAINTESKPEIN